MGGQSDIFIYSSPFFLVFFWQRRWWVRKHLGLVRRFMGCIYNFNMSWSDFELYGSYIDRLSGINRCCTYR
jgi:hypothetical protein